MKALWILLAVAVPVATLTARGFVTSEQTGPDSGAEASTADLKKAATIAQKTRQRAAADKGVVDRLADADLFSTSGPVELTGVAPDSSLAPLGQSWPRLQDRDGPGRPSARSRGGFPRR